MAQINPELLSNKPTHFDIKNNRLVKVFKTVPAHNSNSDSFTAEIMEGKFKGRLTTVYKQDLKQIYND